MSFYFGIYGANRGSFPNQKLPTGQLTNCKPSAAGSIWKGEARERADDVLFCLWHKKTSEQSGLCSDVEEAVEIDIFRP